MVGSGPLNSENVAGLLKDLDGRAVPRRRSPDALGVADRQAGPPSGHGAFIANRAEVAPGSIEAAVIEIVRGRNSSSSDADRPDTQPVVIVSEAMALRFLEDGRRGRLPRPAARRRFILTGPRCRQRREGADARRGTAQRGASPQPTAAHALHDGRGDRPPRSARHSRS